MTASTTIKRNHLSCLLCSNTGLMAYENFSPIELLKCSNCGFIFCLKIPTQLELKNNYQNYRYGINSITIKRYEALLDRFENYRINNNILDVGCGEGYFLEIAKKRGWNVYGTEYLDATIEKCIQKGISCSQGSLINTNYDQSFTFDVITSFEVIEHINNPIEEYSKAYQLLRKGGLLYVTTPNFNSLSKLIHGKKWRIVEYPEHLCYYTPKTLDFLLAKIGFKKNELTATNVSMQKVETFVPEVTVGNQQNQSEKMRTWIEQNALLFYAKKWINYILNMLKVGDAMKAFYTK